MLLLINLGWLIHKSIIGQKILWVFWLIVKLLVFFFGLTNR